MMKPNFKGFGFKGKPFIATRLQMETQQRICTSLNYAFKNVSGKLGCNQTCLQLMCIPALYSKDSREKLI